MCKIACMQLAGAIPIPSSFNVPILAGYNYLLKPSVLAIPALPAGFSSISPKAGPAPPPLLSVLPIAGSCGFQANKRCAALCCAVLCMHGLRGQQPALA